ncbi:putative surface protein with fasciclin (FAS1) repeats [Nonlabens dokdonensis]|jgi:uncharacterized surface protein with fasciclin (FAS1) repeats|uniref:Surface protein with fasciclin (FAS1) repeats n=2 Tax=Nonlabens dokdonensis TaxID=328515 RepID=A0ABX5PW25_9FLAO|nr:fasciclin domain-containing protein [Nonlabens dokdonensis]AGC75158.1 putative cell adhesion protein, fasciclin domain protein [Nonlabens dokdonensis DSW-6]PZX39098.1 putative surface protein with fasciclin (FAS1) repeats [Nonlabens dokdonensis]
MKILKKYSFTLLILLLAITSCEDADDNDNRIDPNNSAYDLTVSNSDLSLFNEALIRTSLDATLDNQGIYTVFAPNNAAFMQFLSTNGFADVAAVPVDQLRAVLLYHVITTRLETDVLTNGYLKTLAKDEEIESLDLYIEASSPILINGNATALQEDINVTNGVVHIIDEVLDLPTITTLINANPDFSNLASGLAANGLDSTLSSDIGTMQAPFTVFAPDNEGFQALVDLDTMDSIDTVQDILDLTNLSDILLYHVLGNDRLRAGEISNGLSVNTIIGNPFVIDTMTGIQFTDGSMTIANITSTDVTAINGIIHTIDIVIRPM